MGRILFTALVILCAGCRTASSGSYLFVWAGDADNKASNFLGVIDANPSSAHYGSILASISTGVAGERPHHTEHEMPASGHLLANDFNAGRTWVFDLTQPLKPRILTSFGCEAGYCSPHTFVRLADGHVLATFQYLTGPDSMGSGATYYMASRALERSTGGLVEMDERGHPLRSGSATDTTIDNKWIYPYSVLPFPAFDRAVSTTTDMNDANTKATSEWLQVWRLSDLKLLRSIALKPGSRGDENQFTGEARLLPDGRSIYVHTFNCGLYLLRGVERADPTTGLVWTFDGKNCGVPILTGHYWVQTVPDVHSVVVLDIADAEHPREVSRLNVGEDELPHWIAIDRTGRRIVLNSSGGGKGNRLFILNFDPAAGRLSFDERFHDTGSTRPGIALTGKMWPHGFDGTPVPHGTLFSR